MDNNIDNSIITKMLEIERDAKSRLEEAEKESAETIEMAEAEKTRIINSKNNAVLDKRERVRFAEKNKTDKRLAEIERDKDMRIKKLDDTYEKNRSKWENDIFNAVIGGK